MYGAILMTVIMSVHSVHLMRAEQRQVASNLQSKAADCDYESACRLLSSALTIAMYYYSASKLIGRMVEDLSQPRKL